MSLLLEAVFVSLGLTAVAVMLMSWKRYVPLVTDLRDALRAPPEADEIRLTVQEYLRAPLRKRHSPLRHRHQRRSSNNRVLARNLRKTAA